MQKIIIGICDDEKSIRNLLYNYIEEYGALYKYEFDIHTFMLGEDLLNSKSIYQCDLLFLDVEMGNINGIQTAHFLRELSELENLQIVFVSAHDKYMKSMFDVRPFQYISKPVSKEEFFKTLDSYCKFFIRKCDFFSFKTGRTMHRLPCSDILYFESKGRKIFLYTKQECIEFYDKLNVLERSLENAGFYRIHQSYLVNPYYIVQYSTQHVVMQNGVTIPVSGKYKSRFIEMQFSS